MQGPYPFKKPHTQSGPHYVDRTADWSSGSQYDDPGDMHMSSEDSVAYQDYAEEYKDWATPERSGLAALWETTIADASLFDWMGRKIFGAEEPITSRTFKPLFNFSGGHYDLQRFEGQDLSPSEELAMLKPKEEYVNFGQRQTDFNTFKRMVKLGLISLDPKSGEVFNPYQQNIEGRLSSAEEEVKRAFESGQFGPSVLYDKRSMGETVSAFRAFEQKKQAIGSELATEGIGEFGKGIIAGDPDTQDRFIKWGEDGTVFGQISGMFFLPVDADKELISYEYNERGGLTKVNIDEELLNHIKEADSEKYKKIMDLVKKIPNQILRVDELSFRKELEDLINDGTIIGTGNVEGQKLVRISDYSATPEETAAYKDAAAPESKSYLIGQGGQIALEFIPVIGIAGDVIGQTFKAGGRLAVFLSNKLGAKAVDKIKFTCSSPCKLSKEGEEILNAAVKNKLLTQQQVDQIISTGLTRAKANNILAAQKSGDYQKLYQDEVGGQFTSIGGSGRWQKFGEQVDPANLSAVENYLLPRVPLSQLVGHGGPRYVSGKLFEDVVNLYKNNKNISINEAIEQLGGDVGYGNVKMILNHAKNSTTRELASQINSVNRFHKNDLEIMELYEKIRSGEVKLPAPIYRQGEGLERFTANFDDLNSVKKTTLINDLKSLNVFYKKKGDRILASEVADQINKFNPEIMNALFLRRQGGFNISPSTVERGDLTHLDHVFMELTDPTGIKLIKGNTNVFNKLSKSDLKKLQEAYDLYKTGRTVTTKVTERIEKLTHNTPFLNRFSYNVAKKNFKDGGIFESGNKIPDLEDLRKIFGEDLTASEAQTLMGYVYRRLNNEKLVPVGYGSKAIDNFMSSITPNKEQAKEFLEELHRLGAGSPFGFYATTSYRIYQGKLDNLMTRPNGNRAYITTKAKENGIVLKGEEIHEPAALSTAGKYDLPSYSNFSVIINKADNAAAAKVQRVLSTYIRQYKNGTITRGELIKKHNDYIDDAGMDDILAKLIFPDQVKGIYTDLAESMGLKAFDDFKNIYGMDLIGEAEKATFGYQMPDGVTLFDELHKGATSFLPTKGNARGGRPRSRKKFKTGDNPYEQQLDQWGKNTGDLIGSIGWAVDEHTKNVQEDILNMYRTEIIEPFYNVKDKIILEQKEVEDFLSDKLNPPKPVKFKWSETPRLLTENPIIRKAGAAISQPEVPVLETIELLYNGIRSGVENDIQMEEFFPATYALYNALKGPGVRETPKEQEYISMIDEINRAQETGVTNFAYSVVDLALSIPDAIFPTEFTDELKKRYAEADLNKPETFLGQLGALAIEFGIPGGVAFKVINRFRKLMLAKSGGKVNLFTQKTYALEGLPKLGVQISNVAKRVGTGTISFAVGDFVAGGPYNTISEMFDDPLLSSKLVGEYEDTSELSGKERVAANFRNRLRFGAEGAMIGGLFPLVGPALGVVGKNVLLKPALWVGGGALKTANVLAIKPATWLASKDPLVLPGIARGAGAFASFLGKDVLARLAATAATGGRAFVPSLKGNYGQLPELSKWRMFDVTSNDPLQRGLKKVDNFLKWFRDSGNQALYSFNLSGGAERFIKSKAREIEKYLTAIETKAYDLANGFLQRYNKAITSPAGQQHMLDQIHEYLRGNLKLSKIEPELQELAKALKEEFNAIKTAYFKELPEGSGLRAALESNLDKYMRMSFATFSNPSYKPSAQVLEDATNYMVGIINKNADFIEAAVRGSKLPADEAIREFARRNVDNMIAIGKAEGIDPLNALNKIQKEILRGDDFIQTGEELPNVIRKLLGQEKNLKHSVMMTAGSLVTQTSNIRAFKEFAKHGLDNGYLFTSRAEALAAGISDPKQIGSLPGLGQMQDLAFADKGGPIGLFTSGEMKASVEGTGGMLDNLLQNSFYQSLIAYKAAVQTGKTVFSPATQSRNFGSAGFFPMHVGHIGGSSSVTDAFKIIMDDIFGAGRTVNEVDLIKRIQRKVELGVLDENIVASELGAILKDIKAGKLNSLGKLAERAEGSKFYKAATRVYAGGDNVWKWYGHEYYMSQLKGGFRNLDDIKKFFTLHGIEFNPKNIMTGATKTLDEGIEEAAAYLLRETYPTYSKVPEFIKAIRKLPIGNFVSFTSEILRTGFATSAIAMKHIASDNQVLREMGYRMLSGQAITLGGMTAGVQGLGYALTNVTPEQLEVYKKYFAPEYMQYSSLIPVSNVEEGGVFKVFDFSRYNPYDIIVSSARELLKVADRRNYSRDLAVLKEQLSQMEDPSTPEAIALRNKIKQLQIMVDMNTKLDPKKIETEVFSQYLNTVGPLWNAVTGTFFGIPIGGEAFIEAATGKTREGSTIWSEGMTNTEKFDRGMNHFFQTIEPGIISSGRKLFHAARGDVSGVGQPLEIDTEVFKLMGGSNVTIDVLGSLDFKISDFQQSFREPKMGKSWYTPKNFKQRGPEQLVLEYREQNEQAFRSQYEFYKAAMAAIDSGLLTRSEVMQALKKRIAPNAKDMPSKIIMLMNGRFVPITYGPEGLKSRMNKIYRNNPDLDRRIYHYQYFYPYGALEREKNKWKNLRFEDFERQQAEPEQISAAPAQAPVQTATAAEPPVAPIPDTGTPRVNPTQIAAGNVDQATGLTQTETALLSPTEKAIRLRQRGMA